MTATPSSIEWTDTTWSPVTGCTKVSQGCKHCYAEREVNGRWSKNPLSIWYRREFTDVRTHPTQLLKPPRMVGPKKIFVCPRADLFHEAVPDSFLDEVFAVMALCPEHIFQVLTKRPERMREYLSAIPVDRWAGLMRSLRPVGDKRSLTLHTENYALPNVWLGVSVEDQATANERIPLLLDTPAAIRWISAEPLLGPVDLMHGNWIPPKGGGPKVNLFKPWEIPGPSLDWCVSGGESGPNARPSHPDWFRSLRDQCQAAGTAYLFKQWGEWAPDRKPAPNELTDARKELIVPVRGEVTTGLLSYGDNAVVMRRVGKKKAGRLLDGVLHDAYPEPPCA